MTKNMIKLEKLGNSPRALGESLREAGGTTEESVAVLRYRQTDLSGVGGGCTRGAAAPGKQFRTFTPLPTLEARARTLPRPTKTSRSGIRLYIYEREKEAEAFAKDGHTSHCDLCTKHLDQYYRLIAAYKQSCGEWLEYRLGLENRTIVKVKRNLANLSKVGVGYNRSQLFIRRIHLVDTLDLIGTKVDLFKVISVVSELNWRPQ
jgi:hypothetical protein